ncbi:MAG: hypothetical protein GC154_04745 [bacterium]|nr:hypothetical protein [bacterium]
MQTLWNFLWFEYSLPLWGAIVISALALTGLSWLGWKAWLGIRLFLLLRRGLHPLSRKEIEARIGGHLNDSDRMAQEIIDAKIRKTWRAFSQTRWLNLERLRDESFDLVKQIAHIYYPSSPQPEYEVTLFELLQLSERIHKEIKALAEPVEILHRVSIRNIIQTRELFEKANTAIQSKSMRAGRRVINGVWIALNYLRPQYWINRAIFTGASEMVGRKVLSTIFRIVGAEAIATYRSSSAVNLDRSLREGYVSSRKEAPRLLDSGEAYTDRELNESKHSGDQTTPDEFEVDEIVPTSETEEPPGSKSSETIPLSEAAIVISDQQEEQPMNEAPMDEEIHQSDESTLYQSVAKTFSQFIEGSLHIWDKVVKPESVIQHYAEAHPSIGSLSDIQRLPVEQCDEAAIHFRKYGEWYSAAEGAVTGMGGFLLLSADAVSLLALQLRTIQQIGYCYGFNASSSEEKLFALKLLVEGYTHPMRKDRETIINEMRSAAKMMAANTPVGLLQKRLFVQGIAKAAEKIGIKFGGRKTAQLLPLIGAAAGGYINKRVTKDVAQLAVDVYRDRFLQLTSNASVRDEDEASSDFKAS